MEVGSNSEVSVHVKALRRGLFTGLGLIGLIGGIGLWAATSTLSGAVMAPGQFVIDTNVKKVQHPSGGIVGELKVREGDLVAAGHDLQVGPRDGLVEADQQVAGGDQVALDRAGWEHHRETSKARANQL